MELIDPSLMAMDHAVGETPSSPEVSSSQSNDLVGGNRGEQEEQKQADVWSGPIGGVQAEDSSFPSHAVARPSTSSAPPRTKSELSASEGKYIHTCDLLNGVRSCAHRMRLLSRSERGTGEPAAIKSVTTDGRIIVAKPSTRERLLKREEWQTKVLAWEIGQSATRRKE